MPSMIFSSQQNEFSVWQDMKSVKWFELLGTLLAGAVSFATLFFLLLLAGGKL